MGAPGNSRFGHHPEALIDFLIEAEELENIASDARLGLTGFGREEDQATLDSRIWAAMEFRVGGDASAIDAKNALRTIAAERGLNLMAEIAYPGQPMRALKPAPQHANHPTEGAI